MCDKSSEKIGLDKKNLPALYDSDVLLNALLNTVGNNLVNYPEYIVKLLRTVPQDVNKSPAGPVCTTLQSVKLIIDVLECNSRNGDNTYCASAVEDVFQCLRDVFDQAPHISIINSALDLLCATCKLSTHSGGIDSSSKFYLYHVHLVQQDQLEEILRIRLRVISMILQTLAQSRLEAIEAFRSFCRTECEGFSESIVFEKLILFSSDAVSSQALLTVVPYFVTCFDATSTLIAIWNAALKDAPDQSHDAKRFSTLCYLFDAFAQKDTAAELDLLVRQLQDEKFWKVIQCGLVHKENMIRRQALYLMKRSVAEMFDKDLTVNSHVMNELNGANFVEKLDGGLIKLSNGLKNFAICNNKVFMVSTGQESVMWWNPMLKEELSNLFNDLFLVFETLEEKQAHIVKPVFQTMIRLLGPSLCPFRNGKRLHVSWILVLFERILNHDNSAVVRWGLVNVTEIDISLYQQPQLLRTVLNLFVSHLNNPSVYVNEIELMTSEIQRFFQSAAATQAACPFYKILIEEITSATWSPETLFIVVNALLGVKVHALESQDLMLVKKFVSTSIATHYTFLRAAIQCHLLHTVINLTNVSQVTLTTLADVLNAFRGPECLQRGCFTWDAVVKWIEYCFSKKNAEEFILDNVPYLPHNSLDIWKTSRMVCLLYDAHLFGLMKCCGEEPSQHVLAVLSSIFKSFKDVDKRLYADQNVLNHNLAFVGGILRENLAGPTPSRSHLVEIMIPNFPDMIGYITSRSDMLAHNADYKLAELFVEMIDLILKGQKMYKVNAEPYVTGILNYSLASLGVLDGEDSPSLVKYVSLQYLKLILNHVYQETKIPRLKLLQGYFKNIVNLCLDRPEEESSSWGKVNSKYLEAQWLVIGQLKSENILTVGQKVRVEPFLTSSELALLGLSALDLGGGSVLLAVMSVIEDILSDLEDELTEQVVQTCWTSVWDRRRSDAFGVAARKFITMLFQPEVIGKSSKQALLKVYSSLLLTESVNGVANAFLTHVQTLGVKYTPCQLWGETLAAALIFGCASRREDRLTQQVSSLISSIPLCAANQLVSNDWNTSSEVRARALQILLTLNHEKHSEFADGIVDSLLNKEMAAEGAGKTRTFSGSPVHHVRTRILQALLVLEPLISKPKSIFLYNWLCAFLLRESHQPSVRYTAEWLIVRIMWRNDELQNTIWVNFTEALEQRIGSLCSFISVVYHTTSVVAESAIYTWLDRAILQFLPYCLAQHFSLRLYAQVAIEKMWCVAEAKGLHQLLDKYRIIRDCQLRTIGNPNVVRNADKLRQDFYWTIFHPLHHFSLQTIFRDLPRLAHVKPDEWITPELLAKVKVPTSVSLVPWSSGDDLWVHPVSSWSVRNEESSMEVAGDNLQKKLIPIKSLLPDYESMLDQSLVTFSRKQRVFTDGLIVVASLVDRAANLGGLCRTCEAFGVSELVIDSLQVLEDKQFQSLSVTSDKWVHITEVKTHYLSDYLLKMKSDGYSIVGAEQTSRSQSLQSVQLPQKCVLLLGSEKEGVPPQLLSLLDVCVEIPQFGVIRSLNVHVTGALFIWEYVKQHTSALR